jgi:phosphoenolpyruvate carboxykinase (ATP)
MQQAGPHISSHGLDKHGIGNVDVAHWNYGVAALYEEALRRREGVLAAGGPLVVRTGHHTGRSANDKFIVEDPASRDNIHWGAVNRPIQVAQFEGVEARLLSYLQDHEIFIQDCWAGADPDHRVAVRVITETAWHSLFAHNMFIAPTAQELAGFVPDFTIIQAPRFHTIPEQDGTNSENFVLVNFERRLVLIGGTSYAGEIKKSVFSILNYLLPERGVLPMHSSANLGPGGDAAVFFGLSGTGKTTLSADPERALIGDDEHGWSDAGIFNFEGGCYAKVIRLEREAEPEIYATTERYGTVLENVVVDMDTRRLDLDDASLTENTRASYPIDFIPNANTSGAAGQPKNVVMLTADAFGVLPPIARLSPQQAMYHFLSGYTAKVAGTEKGLGNEPQATFSTCFGAPFMPRHPSVYAGMLGERIARHGVDCWLVNTGWTGGAFGTGLRMPIAHTRALLRAALDGSLTKAPMRVDPLFGLSVPESCPGVPQEVLTPRSTWADKSAYDAAARILVGRFQDNFTQYNDYVDDGVRAAAPEAA